MGGGLQLCVTVTRLTEDGVGKGGSEPANKIRCRAPCTGGEMGGGVQLCVTATRLTEGGVGKGGSDPANKIGCRAPGTQIKLFLLPLLPLLLLLLLLLSWLTIVPANTGLVAPSHLACCALAATMSSCTTDACIARIDSARDATCVQLTRDVKLKEGGKIKILICLSTLMHSCCLHGMNSVK